MIGQWVKFMKTAVIKKKFLKISLSYQDICMSVTLCVHFTRCEWLEEEGVVFSKKKLCAYLHDNTS